MGHTINFIKSVISLRVVTGIGADSYLLVVPQTYTTATLFKQLKKVFRHILLFKTIASTQTITDTKTATFFYQ